MSVKKSKLAIFDMDGTLFDTSEANCIAYAEAAEMVGYNIDRTYFQKIFTGKNYRDFLPMLGINDIGVIENIHVLKKKLYSKYIDTVKRNEPLFALIDAIRKNYIIALATTASSQNTKDIIQYFSLENFFDIIITQEDVTKLKPDPECYLLAMERANISAENTIIFEDSETGLLAAKCSKAFTLCVYIA